MRNGNSHHVPNSLPVEAKFLWTSKTTGPGHSGVAVAEGRVLFADKSAEEANDVWRCLDAKTGKVVWKTPGAGAAYASPIAANVRGQRQVIAYDAESLGGWDIATGERAWKVVPTKPHDYNVATHSALHDVAVLALGCRVGTEAEL